VFVECFVSIFIYKSFSFSASNSVLIADIVLLTNVRTGTIIFSLRMQVLVLLKLQEEYQVGVGLSVL